MSFDCYQVGEGLCMEYEGLSLGCLTFRAPYTTLRGLRLTWGIPNGAKL